MYTEISWTLFWSTFIMLLRQNTPYSPQGLPKKCIIYVRVLRKHWKSKRQQLYLWACYPCQLHCGTYFGTPNFFKLTLSWIWTAGLEENKPVRSQFLFKCNLSTVNFEHLDWVYVLARFPPRRIQKREINQNNLLFPVTVLPTAT